MAAGRQGGGGQAAAGARGWTGAPRLQALVDGDAAAGGGAAGGDGCHRVDVPVSALLALNVQKVVHSFF